MKPLGLKVRLALRTGVPYRETAALAREEDADLIVVATHGRGGIDRALPGNVRTKVPARPGAD